MLKYSKVFKSVQKRVLQLNQGRAVWSHKSPPILASAASPQREMIQFQKKMKWAQFFLDRTLAVLNFQKGDSKRGLTIKRIGNKKRQSTLVTCIEAYKNEEWCKKKFFLHVQFFLFILINTWYPMQIFAYSAPLHCQLLYTLRCRNIFFLLLYHNLFL